MSFTCYLYPAFRQLLHIHMRKERVTSALNAGMSVYLCGDTINRGVNNMDGNAELLNFIYQNSQMGVETIKQTKE